MATAYDPGKMSIAFGPRGGSLRQIEAFIRRFPGVLSYEISRDELRDYLLVDLRLVERETFDLARFELDLAGVLPLAIRARVEVSGQKPALSDVFEGAGLKPYDPDMTDAELRLRLKHERRG